MAGTVALITDSSVCLPGNARAPRGVRTVPITIHVGDREYRGGIDLQLVYRALERGVPVKSAAPSVLDYLDAIEAAGDGPVVVITPAAEFTGMYRNAVLAAELSDRPVTVIDSRTATAGQGLVVMAAAAARDRSGAVDDVVAAAEEAASRVELVAFLETLDHLRRSGRVPALALGLASQLRVRPVFRLRQGAAERVGLARSDEVALRRVAREWKLSGGSSDGVAAVFHAGRPGRARELAAMMGGGAYITEFSAVMAIHTGPGVVGAAWLRPFECDPQAPGIHTDRP